MDRDTSQSTEDACIEKPATDFTPDRIQPFTLIDGDKLAVPQKPLYAAYVYAAKALSGLSLPERREDTERHRLDSLTKVVLLQNPEHARALSIRKKLLLMACISMENIQKELHWAALTLSISANAKMSPLWHHRRWLLTLLYDGPLSRTLPSARSSNRHICRLRPTSRLPEVTISRELALVDLAAKRYPRNYQAWAYRSWLLRCIQTAPAASQEAFVIGKAHLETELSNLTTHLRLNATDHTAMVYVADLLRSSLATDEHKEDMQLVALDLARRYPHREMPWLFLRSMSREVPAGNVIHLKEQVESLTRSLSDVQEMNKGRQADWEQEETEQAVRYARRTEFYLWRTRSGDTRKLGSVQARMLLEKTRS